MAVLNSCSADSESSISSKDSDAGERDSVVVHDSVNIIDSIRIIDSVRIKDKVKIRDSVRIIDSVRIKDKVKIRDSVRIIDSLHIIDSVNVKDSIKVVEKIKYIDSVVVRDSVVLWNLEYALGKCSKDNAGEIMPYITDDGVRYFECDSNAALWRGASRLEVNNYYVQKSAVKAFAPLDSVFNILAEGEKLVVVVRHAERNDDSASSTPLNANGVQQALDLGGKLASNLEFHYGASSSIRTQQTCRYIAAGRVGVDTLADLSVDTLSHMGGTWYVKDDDIYTKATNEDKGSWYVLSKWIYKGLYSDAFYDFEPRCAEWIDSVAIQFSERAGTDVAFIVSHDLLIMPLVAYVSAKNIDLKYYTSKHWLNYLSGFAIILKPDGSRVFYAVRGLDIGWIDNSK